MAFIPRASFAYPLRTPSWYAGHMARSLRLLPELLADVDLLVEARDARLPLSGANGVWEGVIERGWGMAGAGGVGYGYGYGMGHGFGLAAQAGEAGPSRLRGQAGQGGLDDADELDALDERDELDWRDTVAPGGETGTDRKGKRRERIVVFTKRDLAEARYEEPLRKAFWKHARQRVLFADTRADADARAVLQHAVRLARDNGAELADTKVLVVGMPNVGKSSLLNALRRVGVHKGKAFTTGAEPGVTRRLTGTVKVHDRPAVYVYDTPGVMVPYLGHGAAGAERALKLALTAGIKSSLFEQDAVADYLLYKLNLRLAADELLPPGHAARRPPYPTRLPLRANTPPTNSLPDLLTALAARLGALGRGAAPDLEAAAAWLTRAWRDGRLGRYTLDDLDGREAAAARVYAAAALSGPAEDDAGGLEIDDVLEEGLAFGAGGGTGDAGPLVDAPDAQGRHAPAPAPAPVMHAVPDAPDAPDAPVAAVLDGAALDGATLDARVDAAVAAHLRHMRAERDDAEAGRGRSQSQVRKAEVRARADAARARQRAKARR